jgi:arylsulfatase A
MLALLALLPQGHVSAGAVPPNIAIVHADDLGYGDLGCYGHPMSRTPAIDRMAAQGLRFTQFYSGSPVCSPSRSALITGRLMPRTGIYCANGTEACAKPDLTSPTGCCNGVFLPGMPGGLPKSERTVAELLSLGGVYTSMHIGKWHLGMDEGYLPTQRGFDHYFGVPHGLGACPCAACFAPNTSCAIGCNPSWVNCPVFANATIIQQPANLLTLSDQYTEAAVAFIHASASRAQPWLIYYASHHVHSPQFAGPLCTNSTPRGRFGDSLAELDSAVDRLLLATYGACATNRTSHRS